MIAPTLENPALIITDKPDQSDPLNQLIVIAAKGYRGGRQFAICEKLRYDASQSEIDQAGERLKNDIRKIGRHFWIYSICQTWGIWNWVAKFL
jgi:hypothetical protein